MWPCRPLRYRTMEQRRGAAIVRAWGAAAAAPVALTAAAPAALPIASGPTSLLVGVGTCLLAAAFSALVFYAIPTLLVSMRRVPSRITDSVNESSEATESTWFAFSSS